VFWYEGNTYTPISLISNATPADVVVDLSMLQFCSNSYTCFTPIDIIEDPTTALGETVACYETLCFTVNEIDQTGNVELCLNDGTDVICMLANDQVNNDTIGNYDFVIWYNDTAYDTVTL